MKVRSRFRLRTNSDNFVGVDGLAAARSRHGSECHLGIHSLPCRRFATSATRKMKVRCWFRLRTGNESTAHGGNKSPSGGGEAPSAHPCIHSHTIPSNRGTQTHTVCVPWFAVRRRTRTAPIKSNPPVREPTDSNLLDSGVGATAI